jgi:hypothetical protein
MGFPEFSMGQVDPSLLLPNIVASIALEETALAVLLDSEAGKIQYALDHDFSLEDLIRVNTIVRNVVDETTYIEKMLKNKFLTVKYLNEHYTQ